MKPISKKIIIASVCLIVGGAVLTGVGMMFGGWPGVALTKGGIVSSNSKQSEAVTLEKTKLDAFSEANITIDSYADIQILPSDDENYYLEYLLDKSFGVPEYHVAGNKLTVYQPDKNTRVFVAFSTINDYIKTYVNLYVPKDKVLDFMQMYNDSGDVSISGIQFKDADIEVDYGEVLLKDSSFDSLNLTIDTGDLKLDNTNIGTFTLENEYGNNTLKNFKCDTASIELDSGDLYMDAAEINELSCNSEYGKITLLLPENLETYSFDVSVDYGDIKLPENAPRGFYSNRDHDEEYYQTEGTSNKVIKLYSDSDDIEIRER